MLTPAQSRGARAMLGWNLQEVAKRSRVSDATINRFEIGKAASHPATQQALRQAFEAAGVEFGEDGWLRLKTRTPASP